MFVLWFLMLFFLGGFWLLSREERKELLMRMKPLKKVKKDYQKFFFEILRTQHLGEEVFQKLNELPHFSLYKESIEKFLSLTREIGAPKKNWAEILRNNFHTQINFKIEVQEKVKEILFQLFLVYSLTYLFSFLIQNFLERLTLNLIPIFFGHFVGAIIFIFGLRLILKKSFQGTEETLSALVSFQCLVALGLSQQRVIELSRIAEVRRKGIFEELHTWLDNLIFSWRNRGNPILEEIRLIQDEAWWQMEQAREKFFLHLSGFRLLILFLFAIPSYFYLIYQVGAALIANT